MKTLSQLALEGAEAVKRQEERSRLAEQSRRFLFATTQNANAARKAAAATKMFSRFLFTAIQNDAAAPHMSAALIGRVARHLLAVDGSAEPEAELVSTLADAIRSNLAKGVR